MNNAHASSSHATQIPYSHPHSHMNGHAQAPLARTSSQHMDMGHVSPSSGQVNGSGSSSGQPKFSNGPHIRSRITVVCAECKRLKLKCDRRTPCSSCIKRDTIPRCVYSQAAAEKIDVQSLHNRVLVIEGMFAKMSEAPPNASVQNVFGNIGFKAPFGSAPMLATTTPGGSAGSNASMLPCISNDRALLATGAHGSSVVISLDDVASIWLNEYEDILHGQMDASSSSPSTPRVKVEPTPILLSSPASFSCSTSASSLSSLPRFVPPIPYSKFIPSPEPVGNTHVTNGADLFPAFNSSAPEPLPQVTPELLNYLPPKERRAQMIHCLEETMVLHPCFHVGHWVKRVEAMIAWAEGGFANVSPLQASASTSGSMRELAREVFFGPPPGKRAKTPKPKPTLNFFASACAGLALGALVASKGKPESPGGSPSSHSGSRPGTSSSAKGLDVPNEVQRCSPAALFALSEQALSLAERTATYDVDSIVAMILQLLYSLHCCPGGMSVQQGVFPLVGKMINVARMMGLANDPDEFPGTYSLFDAEARRRVWWDVFYYDLFISDCMGHPPLIPDNSFTTHLPADVDEDAFGPSSTVLPGLSEMDDGPDKGSAYFALKCRLAQLVKNVKKQTFRDPLGEDSNELSIDQAAMFESDVTTFLTELPSAFRLEFDHEWSEPSIPTSCSPASSALLAQKCELAILANRVILKLYLPFLKDNHMGAGRHQAVLATLHAAHAIIYSSRMLHGVWANTRPAAFDFYDFSRALFDAAVVCAHAVIQQPGGMLAREALRDVACASDVLRTLSSDPAADKSRADAVRVVEMMKRKAEAARSNGGSSAGVKRKRDGPDDDGMEAGFQFPFVGPSVSSVKADPARSSAKTHSAFLGSKDASLAPSEASGRKEKKQMREKDREKDKGKPPPVGIRARPPAGSGRSRGASTSGNTAAMSAPHPLPPPRHTATPSSGPSSASSSSASHVHAIPSHHPPPAVPAPHDAYAQRAPQTPVQPAPVHDRIPHEEFQMSFSSEDVDRRRYGSTFSESPQGPSLFDPASLSQPSPVSYNAGPTPPNYYQYAPPPGPPQAVQGYETPQPMGHAQNVAPPMGSLPMDTAAGQAGLPMSTMVESRYGMPYRPEHAQTMPAHEYHPQQQQQQSQQQQQQQSMPLSNSHAWLPPEHSAGAEMWNEYKYVG